MLLDAVQMTDERRAELEAEIEAFMARYENAFVIGDYFVYSYLEPDAQLLPSGISDFNAPWFHAQIACYEGELVTYHWVGPTTMYPPGPRS